MRFKVAITAHVHFKKGNWKIVYVTTIKLYDLSEQIFPRKLLPQYFVAIHQISCTRWISRSLCFIPSSFSLHLKALHGSLPPCSSHHVWTSYEDFCLLFIKKVARGEGRTSHMIIQKYKTLRKLPPEQVKEITSTNKIHYELDMKINIWKWLFWVDPTSMYAFHQ